MGLRFPLFFFKVLCCIQVCLGDNIINHFIHDVQPEIIFIFSISRRPLQNVFIVSEVSLSGPEIIYSICSVPLPELAAGLPISANTSLYLQMDLSTSGNLSVTVSTLYGLHMAFWMSVDLLIISLTFLGLHKVFWTSVDLVIIPITFLYIFIELPPCSSALWGWMFFEDKTF